MPKKKYIYPIIYSLVLTAFTTYLALDTFVISDVYGKAAENNSFVFSSPSGSPSSAIETQTNSKITSDTKTASVSNITDDNSYSDENIQITLSQYREYDTEIYVADVTVSSLEYLKTAFANNTYGRNITQKTSDIAESVNAIFAVNGDFYGAQESGYVIRNGTLYRSQAKSGNEDLVIWANGSFEVISENAVTAQQLLDKGAYQVLSFGPGLLENNEISVSENEEVGKAMSSNPRTAIGILGSNHFVFVVSDGRTNESTGLSLYQLAEFMQGLGVKTAYNLDGGGSSTMYFNGKVINNPTTNGKTIQERSVSDNVYIGY